MCWLTDSYFVYCSHHSPRTIFSPCIRAMPLPGNQPNHGLSRTGCWNSPCVNHIRVLDFCTNCRASGKDRESDRRDDGVRSRYGQHAPATPPRSEEGRDVNGEGIDIPGVYRRTEEERGDGSDSKIWLKSFGGSSVHNSAENSRRGSVDSDGRRSSGQSVNSPEVKSKSQYSKGSSAAWGMTPQELRRRSTTLDSGNSSLPPSPGSSGRSSLSSVPEQPSPQLYRDCRRRQIDDLLRVEQTITMANERRAVEVREVKAMELGYNIFAPYLKAAQTAKEAERQEAKPKEDAEIRVMMDRPAQLLKEVRRLRLKAEARSIMSTKSLEICTTSEVFAVESVPIQDEMVELDLKATMEVTVSTMSFRGGSLDEVLEIEREFVEDERVLDKHARKDSAICMEFDGLDSPA